MVSRVAAVGSLAALGIVAGLGGAAGPRAAAATVPVFTVTSTLDGADDSVGDGKCTSAAAGGKCTLRAAVQEADAVGGPGGTVLLPAGTFHLSIPVSAATEASTAGAAAAVDSDSGDLDVMNNAVTIHGAGAGLTTIDAGGIDSILATSNTATIVVTDLTMTGGDPTHNHTNQGIVLGGAILNQGTATLQRVALVHNLADGGGGMFSVPGTTPTISDSLIADNSAYGGGGLRLDAGGTITNTTITGNHLLELDPTSTGVQTRPVPTAFATGVDEGSGWGGGIDNRGTGNVVIVNSTITDNHAVKGGGGLSTGQGYAPVDPAVALGIMTVRNSIVAGNTSDTGGNCHIKDQVIQSLGNNVSNDDTCFLTATGDKPSTDPKLAALADNGGPTDTQALLPGSPALGAAAVAGCPDHDQRGVSRPAGKPCDIGAFQSNATTTGAPVVATAPAVPTVPKAPAASAAAPVVRTPTVVRRPRRMTTIVAVVPTRTLAFTGLSPATPLVGLALLMLGSAVLRRTHAR